MSKFRTYTLPEIINKIPPKCSLTPIKIIEGRISSGIKRSWILCKCICGKEHEVMVANLLNKQHGTKSCGCLVTLNNKKRAKYFPVIRKLHDVYSKMINRCYDSRDTGYKNYGGRGVLVCD